MRFPESPGPTSWSELHAATSPVHSVEVVQVAVCLHRRLAGWGEMVAFRQEFPSPHPQCQVRPVALAVRLVWMALLAADQARWNVSGPMRPPAVRRARLAWEFPTKARKPFRAGLRLAELPEDAV